MTRMPKFAFMLLVLGMHGSSLGMVSGEATISSHDGGGAVTSAIDFGSEKHAFREKTFAYRIYVPKEQPPQGGYPLLLWLHGYGQAGDDNQSQLLHLDRALAHWQKAKGPFPAIVLVPQCPHDEPTWCEIGVRDATSLESSGMLSVASDMLERICAKHSVDEDRIYLAGVSSGGNGCWELAVRQPKRFAAAAPMASSYRNETAAPLLKDMPIWAFHTHADMGAPVTNVRSMTEAIRRADGRVGLTEIAGTNHDCWTAAFDDYHLLDWLLAQKHGTVVWEPPLQGSTIWRSLLFWFALVIALTAVALSERNRRAKLKRILSDAQGSLSG